MDCGAPDSWFSIGDVIAIATLLATVAAIFAMRKIGQKGEAERTDVTENHIIAALNTLVASMRKQSVELKKTAGFLCEEQHREIPLNEVTALRLAPFDQVGERNLYYVFVLARSKSAPNGTLNSKEESKERIFGKLMSAIESVRFVKVNMLTDFRAFQQGHAEYQTRIFECVARFIILANKIIHIKQVGTEKMGKVSGRENAFMVDFLKHYNHWQQTSPELKRKIISKLAMSPYVVDARLVEPLFEIARLYPDDELAMATIEICMRFSAYFDEYVRNKEHFAKILESYADSLIKDEQKVRENAKALLALPRTDYRLTRWAKWRAVAPTVSLFPEPDVESDVDDGSKG